MSTIQIYDGEKFVPFNISNAIEMPVGFEDYVSYKELDPGQLIRNGQLVSREIYSDLWNFVQSKPSMLLTEEEWQANLTANEGLACNYYSAGNGSTNFRLPKASVIVLPDPNPENINKYSTDTQRNITGSIGEIFAPDPPFTTGAFSEEVSRHIHVINDEGANHIWKINFDASRSVGADHTGEEVKPKSITKLPIVYAFGRIVNAGELDFQTVVQKQNDLTLNHQIKSFTDLTQIGLTNGIEQLQDIGRALPDNSQITYRIWEKDNHNHIIYPSVSGIFTMEKSLTFCRCFFNSITPNKQWQSTFDYRDEFYNEPTWELLAKNNKLSMPSNNKIIINLIQQYQAWTAPSDGWVWAIKLGDGNTIGAWFRCYNNPDPKQATFGQLVYSDYGIYGNIDLCGYMPVAKGTTLYFSWAQNAKVYFIPALNNNMPVYNEDVRIYFKAVDSNNNIISGASVKVSIADDSGDIVILSGETLSDGRYLVPQDKWLSLTGLDDSQLITCTMTKGAARGSVEYSASFFKENKIYDLEIPIV